MADDATPDTNFYVVSLTRGSWALLTPGDRDRTDRQPSGNLLL